MKQAKAKKPKLLSTVTAKDFREYGSDIMNRSLDGSQDVFEERWISHFGVEAEVCAEAWGRLDMDLAGPNDEAAKPYHLLWALLLLKTYNTESVLTGMCGGVDEDTIRKWAWDFIEKVSYLEPEVVSLKFLCDMSDISKC